MRRVAARAPDGVVPALVYAYERVVAAGEYLAVVQQKAIRDARELFRRLGVFVHDGRVGEVRARHHEAVEILAQKQHVQRRVRDHYADIVVLAQVQARSPGALFEQHDGPAEGRERPLLGLGDLAEPPRGGGVPAHHGEGLFVPVLAEAQPRHRRLILRETGEMHPAKALDAEDTARFYELPRRLDAVARQPAAPLVEEEGLRPAGRAAVGLGVVAPVFNVRKLRRAVRAHRKLRHGGVCPVVGYGADYREARPAVGAVYEGIAVAPVGGVEQLAQAVRADARVRRDQRPHALPALARDYAKALEGLSPRHAPDLHGLDERQRRRALPELREEALKSLLRTLKLQLRALGAVPNPARQAVLPDQPVHKGAKAHALHYPVYIYVKSCQFSPNNVKNFTFVAIRPSISCFDSIIGQYICQQINIIPGVVIEGRMC